MQRHLQSPESQVPRSPAKAPRGAVHDYLQGLQVPSCSGGQGPAPVKPRPRQAPPLPAPSPLLPGQPEELPGGRDRRKPSERLGGGGGRMGDSKVKVAVRIRPMNRRGESRARLGPPRRRWQVPGAPFPSRRPPCGVRPPSSWSPYPGGRAAGAPRNLFPLARPACAGRPSPRPHRVPGRSGPHVSVCCPFRRRGRPAPPPSRPLALSLPLPFQEGALVPRPWLASSFPDSRPSARASPRSRCPLASCHFGPRPLGPHPSGLAETARDRPRGPKSLAQSTQPCTLLAGGRENGREFDLLLLRKHSSAKIPRLAFSLFISLTWTVIKSCKYFDWG